MLESLLEGITCTENTLPKTNEVWLASLREETLILVELRILYLEWIGEQV